MFKMGFKKIFLVLCLIISSSFVFVACKDDEISANSISFKETSGIVMVVGTRYKPEVSVLPSYAGNKKYYFELNSNSEIIEIDGQYIKALKEGVAQLKVVSEENKFLNDVISVKVIPEAISLTAPKNLSFNGSEFVFETVENAEAYILNVNGVDYNLNTENKLNLTELGNLIQENPYNKILKVKVKAVGDERVTISSDYSAEISIFKIGSPKNLTVENNILSFSKVEGVKFYNVKFSQGGDVVKTLNFNAESSTGSTIKVSLNDLKSYFVGGEYECSVLSQNSLYDIDNVTVFESDESKLNFNVLKKATNVNVSHYLLNWDNVLGANSYSIYNEDKELVASNVKTNSFDLTSLSLTGGSYGFYVVAYSDDAKIVDGINASDVVNFKILPKTSARLVENDLVWDEVPNAVNYQLVIKNGENEILNTLIEDLKYPLNTLDNGNYSYKIYSCGDGKNNLKSLDYETGTFSVLQAVKNLKIENEVVSWEGVQDEIYSISIFDNQNELVISNVQSNNSFNLSGYNFDSSEYCIKVVNLGKNNEIDSKTNELRFYKLSDVSNIVIENEVVKFKIDNKTINTKVVCAKTNNLQTNFELTQISLTEFSLDSSLMNTGEYIINVYAYGNKANILDADNLKQGIIVNKLEAPELNIDKINSKIIISDSESFSGGYEIYCNGEYQKTVFAKEFLYETEYAGEYIYRVKTLGNRTNIISSDISNSNIKILKLSTPKLTFEKATRTFNIEIEDGQGDFIGSYDFKLNGESVAVDNGHVDCSNTDLYFRESREYVAIIRLIPNNAENYDLILNSNTDSLTIQKIDASASISLANGRVLIDLTNKPENFANYSSKLKIGYKNSGENYVFVEYNDLKLANNKYYFDIMNSNYDAIGPFKEDKTPVFETAGTYLLKWEIESNDNETLTSDSTILGNIIKLSQVSNVRREGELLKFDNANNASGYKLWINENGVDYKIDLPSECVEMSEIKSLFASQGLVLKDGNSYSAKIVSVGDDNNKILSTKTTNNFEIKFLNAPKVSFVENGFGDKFLSIKNDILNANSFDIICTDGENHTFSTNIMVSQEENLTFRLDNIVGLATGQINVTVISKASVGNYYQSSETVVTYTQLDTPVMSVNDGLLSWNFDDNASYYILYYNVDGEYLPLNLTNGTENYNVSEGIASFDLTQIVSGEIELKLKAVAKLNNKDKYYYDSPISSKYVINKLSKANVSISDGNIVLSVKADEILNIQTIIISNGKNNIDIFSLVDEIVENMTITPDKLLQYISDTEIEIETFVVNVYATVESGFLNSNSYEFSVKGLKCCDNLSVNTTINLEENIPETLDKIVWNNNSLNNGLIKGFVIVINYKDKDYTYNLTDGNASFYTFPSNAEFGAGEYKIKVKVLAINSNIYVNSKFCEEYVISVCDVAKDIKTQNGVMVWDSVSGAEKYLVKIFDENSVYQTSANVKTNEFNFNTLGGRYASGLYYVTIQALNETDKRIVSGATSEPFEVVRLAPITKYYLDNGELYIYCHSFTSKVILTLYSETNLYTFECDLTDNVSSYVSENNLQKWSDATDLNVVLNNDIDSTSDYKLDYNLFKVPFTEQEKVTIFDCISDGYKLKFEAVGNSESNFSTVNSVILDSSNNSEVQNINVLDSSTLIKTKTPTVEVNKRGVVSWKIESTIYSDMNYDGLQNVLIYKVKISSKAKEYEFYTIDYVDLDVLKNTEGVTVYEFKDTDLHTYAGYLIYNGKYINILKYSSSAGTFGTFELDFKNSSLYYVDVNGIIQKIDIQSGGNFDVSISIIGDDTKYLTSNSSTSISIVRYQQLTLNVEDGNLIWENLNQYGDDPIYLLEITDNDGIEYLVYLYNIDNPYYLSDNTPKIIEGRTFTQALDFSKNVVKYMLDTQDDSGNYLFGQGNFAVKLTIYYRDNTVSTTLESITSPSYKVTKISQLNVSIQNGSLTWTQAKAYNNQYIYNYELVISDGIEEYIYRISQNDYKLANNNITFTLSKDITLFNGEEFTFVEGQNYYISVRALGGEYVDYITSNNSLALSTSFTNQISNLIMDSGVLVWDSVYNEGSYQVKIVYELKDGKEITIFRTVDQKYFVLPVEAPDISGQTRELTSDYIYKISVRRIGNNTNLTSFPSEEITVEKLKQIDNTTVYSNLGELTWDDVTNIYDNLIDGIEYVIHFNNIDLDDVVVSESNYDFANIPAGEIKFTLKAIHNDYFDAVLSNEITVNKLGAISQIDFVEKDEVLNTLTWEPIQVNGIYADGYLIMLYDGENETPSYTLPEYFPDNKTSTIYYTIDSINIENMGVRIKAISNEATSNVINGELSSRFNLTMASNIDSEYFVVNGLNFEWRQISNEQENDKYLLKYTYRAKIDQISYSTANIYVSDYYTIEENGQTIKVYYYQTKAVGVYKDISVTVNRSSSLSSNSVYMQNNGENVVFIFDKFESGDGSESNPYSIASLTNLKNMILFPNANYILKNDIELATEEIIFDGEFGGTFNGNNKTLFNYSLTSTGDNIAMFKFSNMAHFYDLNLSYINITAQPVCNTSNFYGGILIGKAKNTTFENVNISYSTLNVDVVDNLNYLPSNYMYFYYGGIVGYAENCKISSCNIGLGYADEETTYSTIKISGWNKHCVYYGGVVGYGIDCEISGDSEDYAKLNLYYKTKISIYPQGNHTTYPSVYIGGVIGYMTVSEKNSTNATSSNKIQYLTVNVNQSFDSVGEVYATAGVCAYLDEGKILNVNVLGNIGGNLDSKIFGKIFLGKLVAIVSSNMILLLSKSENQGVLINYNNADDMILSYGNGVSVTQIINQ